MPDQRHYAAALSELLSQNISLGIFAECFASSQGDEQRTKAAYIERRATELEEQELLADQLKKEKELAIIEADKRDKLDKQQKFREEYSFQRFKDENQAKIMFAYFNRRQQEQMYERWINEKLRNAGLI